MVMSMVKVITSLLLIEIHKIISEDDFYQIVLWPHIYPFVDRSKLQRFCATDWRRINLEPRDDWLQIISFKGASLPSGIQHEETL